MSKQMTSTKVVDFDAAKYLTSDEAVAEYLSAIIAYDDTALLTAALGDIARARGMSTVAQASGIRRESLYKALKPDSQPRFSTISKVCQALNLRLVAQPVERNLAS